MAGVDLEAEEEAPLAFPARLLDLLGVAVSGGAEGEDEGEGEGEGEGRGGRGVRLRFAFVCAMLAVETFAWFHHTMHAQGDVEAVTEGMGIGLQGLSAITRYAALVSGRRRLRALRRVLARAPAPPGENARLERNVRRVTLAFIASYLLAVMSFTALPWFGPLDPRTGRPPAPLPLSLPVDDTRALGYYFNVASQVSQMLLFTLMIPTTDCTLAALMAHVALRLRGVAVALDQLRPRDDAAKGEAKGRDSGDGQWARRLRQCVRDHQVALGLLEEVNGLLNVAFGVQVLCSSVVFCSMAYHVTREGATPQVIVGQTALLVPFIMELYVFCLVGQGVIDQGAAVEVAAWASGWEAPDAPPALRRDLRLLLLRAQKPTRVHALYVSDVSLSTFGEVLKLSYSYYNLLKEVNG